ALTFGTLLSSQGTDTSFRRLSPALRALRSFVIPAYQIRLPLFNQRFSFLKSGVNRRLAATRPTIAGRRAERESGRAGVTRTAA
ncbi:hypothetical protein ACFVGM_35895, partial [Kitasatospora purpeofusca]|uniref:hypothetical protein n=1 Tax=Kitasatospora purpeofusca TaxID=67352 RepID=UPI0036B485BD